MKKIICTLLALLLIIGTAVPTYAATPALKIPDMPEISSIQLNVKLDEKVAENAVDKWLAAHPIKFDFSKIKLPAWYG